MKPLYMQVIDFIMEKINSGEWKEGDMLPTEVELCQMFQVSRQTARTALSHLVNEGYLVRTKGRGTFITQPKVIESSTIFLESFSQEMHRQGFSVKNEVLEIRSLLPPVEVAKKLEIPPTEEVVKLKRLRYQEDNFQSGAIVLTTSWCPSRFSYLLKYDFEQRSLHDVFGEHGTARKMVEKDINVRLLEPRDCRLMGVADGSAAIFIASRTYDQNNQLMEYSESLYPSERNKFIIKIRF